MLKESWRHPAIMIHLMWFMQVQTAVNSSFYCSDKKCCDLLEFILHIVPTHHRRVERKKKFSYNSCFVLTERGRWLKHKKVSTGARKLLWDPIRGCPRNMWSFTTTPSRGSQRGLLMGERWFWWCRVWVCFKHVAWTLSEPPRPPRHCMGVISQCSERWREGVYVAGVQLYAVVLNEAMSEHGENTRVLATSKTPAVFWLCFPVVPRLMGAPWGCGSNSCKQAVWSKMTLQLWKDIYFMDNATFSNTFKVRVRVWPWFLKRARENLN